MLLELSKADRDVYQYVLAVVPFGDDQDKCFYCTPIQHPFEITTDLEQAAAFTAYHQAMKEREARSQSGPRPIIQGYLWSKAKQRWEIATP